MSNSKWLTLFAGIYLCLSALLFFNVPNIKAHFEVDSSIYTNQAENFERYGSFEKPGTVKCLHPYSIGYPIFIVFSRLILGKNYASVIFLQIILALIMIFLTFRIAYYIFSKNIALISAFLVSVNLGFLLYPQLLLSETLICFLLIFALERFISFWVRRQTSLLIMSGFLFGLSITVKASALYLIFLLPIFLIFFLPGVLLKKTTQMLAFFLAFTVPVGSYLYRNKQIYGYYYLKSIDKINLYFYFFPKILEETEGLSYKEAVKKIQKEGRYSLTEYASGRGWSGVNKFFIDTIKGCPLLATKIWMKNVFKTFLGLYTNHLKVLIYGDFYFGVCSFFKFSGSVLEKAWKYVSFGTNSKFLIFLGIFEFLTMMFRYLMIVFAFLFLLVERKYLFFLLFSSFIGYFGLITGHDGCGRFRFIFESPLIILSVVGLFVVLNLVFKKNFKILREN
ncbi:glycosyltransferase family 39 protein [Candidatus Babeliales bacterium]|nr:glycosyltransferase family 39 protein [Candidatus Babeliales bacterium]